MKGLALDLGEMVVTVATDEVDDGGGGVMNLDEGGMKRSMEGWD